MEKTVLHNLRTAIQERFGTQLKCAKAAGINSIRLNRICCGWTGPTPFERERLAETLKANAAWLFATRAKIPNAERAAVDDSDSQPSFTAELESIGTLAFISRATLEATRI